MLENLLAFSPIAGLALNALSLVAWRRLRPGFGLLRSEYLGFAIGALGVLAVNALVLLLDPRRPAAAIVGHGLLTLLSYGALGYCHFHFVNLGETARRIRLLRELYDAGGSLPHRELLRRYGAREIVEKRLARLLRSGQVVCREGRYHRGRTTVAGIARALVVLRVLLLGTRSEHDSG